MARAIFFNTLAYADKLKEAGIEPKQAEAQAKALAAVLEEGIATKQDVDELRRDIDVRFAENKADIKEIRAEIKTIDTKITWLITLIAVIGIALTISNYMHQ